MKIISILLIFCSLFAQAEETPVVNSSGEDLTKIIESYSKASGQKFIIESNVRGKISYLLPATTTIEEQFNNLSIALAINGYAINKQGDVMVVRSARNAQRDFIEVSTERPSMKPERMYTWIYNLKNIPASAVNRDLRILTSKDGEMAVNETTNQLVLTDWVTNLNRVADILKELDKKVDPSVLKIVEASKKESDARRKEHVQK